MLFRDKNIKLKFSQRHPVAHKFIKGFFITETVLLGLIVVGGAVVCLTRGTASPKFNTAVGDHHVSVEADSGNPVITNLSTHQPFHNLMEKQLDPQSMKNARPSKSMINNAIRHAHPHVVYFSGHMHHFQNEQQAQNFMASKMKANVQKAYQNERQEYEDQNRDNPNSVYNQENSLNWGQMSKSQRSKTKAQLNQRKAKLNQKLYQKAVENQPKPRVI